MNPTTSTGHVNVNAKPRKHRKKSGWTPIGIAAMVLGFMVSWPIGLAVIAYMMWGGRVDDLIKDTIDLVKGAVSPAPTTSGNAAFDEYKAATLRDLEEQQAEFAEYVEQLRQARDREEFEHYMKSKKK